MNHLSLLFALLVVSCLPASAAEALAQNYSSVFHNPDPEYYVEGCGLTKLDDGSLLAVVPVVPPLTTTDALDTGFPLSSATWPLTRAVCANEGSAKQIMRKAANTIFIIV